MNVTVFGGANPKPGQPAYQEAFRLGELLACEGHAVLTGGYIGTMEAVSQGAALAGGHVIGVTCQEVEMWRKSKPNAWIKEERRFVTLQDRLSALIDGCDAAMALPGGAGTMAEIALMWNRMIIEAISPRPLILIGKGWSGVMQAFFEGLGDYVSERDRNFVRFAVNVEQAVLMLKD
jgi:uncharacterized protein (TIGR00725 family)